MVQISRMIQSGSGAGFLAKAFQRLRVGNDIFWKELDGGEAAELRVFRLIDDTPPAAAKFFEDAVMGDRLSHDGKSLGHEWATS